MHYHCWWSQSWHIKTLTIQSLWYIDNWTDYKYLWFWSAAHPGMSSLLLYPRESSVSSLSPSSSSSIPVKELLKGWTTTKPFPILSSLPNSIKAAASSLIDLCCVNKWVPLTLVTVKKGTRLFLFNVVVKAEPAQIYKTILWESWESEWLAATQKSRRKWFFYFCQISKFNSLKHFCF